MRTTTAFALLLLPTLALANPFPKGDAKLGEQLVTKQNCESCHAQKMGGDGSAIYTRKDRIIHDAGALLQRVATCSAQTNAGWFPEDESNVAAYLNQKFYHFK
jgi:mono/diheme cytochrome c family protein